MSKSKHPVGCKDCHPARWRVNVADVAAEITSLRYLAPGLAIAACPYCGDEQFYVNSLGAFWFCFACSRGGDGLRLYADAADLSLEDAWWPFMVRYIPGAEIG